jgi:Domain of unknown function (DUF4349)
MSSHNDIDERFDDLVRELRSGHPSAPAELRERVSAIVAEAPVPKQPRAPFAERFRVRRAALVLVPACLIAAGSAAVLHGLTSPGSQRDAATSVRAAFAGRPADEKTASGSVPNAPEAKTAAGTTHEPALAPPVSSRLQDYRVSMRVRLTSLDGLSSAVVKAMRVTRSLGGYVANVEYSSPSTRHGDAVLVLRVPIANVQRAVLAYAGLGSLVAQHFTVVDVQKQYDAQVERVAKLRFQIAKLNAQIASGSLSGVDLANAKEQVEYARLTLHRFVSQKQSTLNHARLSTVRLSMTTVHAKKKHVVPAAPSKLDTTLGDAGRVLGHEAVWVLYALVVGGPLAFFALLMLIAERSRRRRTERRLLATAR